MAEYIDDDRYDDPRVLVYEDGRVLDAGNGSPLRMSADDVSILLALPRPEGEPLCIDFEDALAAIELEQGKRRARSRARAARWDFDLAHDTGESELDACEERASVTGDDWGAVWPVRSDGPRTEVA